MSPLPSRICSVIDCGRRHYAQGLCERHYRAERRKGRLSRNPDVRVVCSWCSVVIREGSEPVSHGLCPSCLAKHFPEEASA